MLYGGGELPTLSQAESKWSSRVPATVAASVKSKGEAEEMRDRREESV